MARSKSPQDSLKRSQARKLQIDRLLRQPGLQQNKKNVLLALRRSQIAALHLRMKAAADDAEQKK